jgi:hypothetical protein
MPWMAEETDELLIKVIEDDPVFADGSQVGEKPIQFLRIVNISLLSSQSQH